MLVNAIDCSDYLVRNSIEQLECMEEYELLDVLQDCQVALEKVKDGEYWNTNGKNYEYVQLTFHVPPQNLNVIKNEVKKPKSLILRTLNNVLMAEGFIHVHWLPIVKLLPTPLQLDDSKERNISKWNGCFFRSKPEVKIAEAFEKKSIAFISNGRGRFNKENSRATFEPDFVVFYNGKVGILEVDGEKYHPDLLKEDSDKRDQTFNDSGISIVKHYDSEICKKSPEKVVSDFLSSFD
jgi:hypothetical protein